MSTTSTYRCAHDAKTKAEIDEVRRTFRAVPGGPHEAHPQQSPPGLKATDAEVRASKKRCGQVRGRVDPPPRPEVAFKVPTIHISMSGPLLYEYGEGVLQRHRHLALDAASMTEGALDRLTSTQLHWLLFNRQVRTRVLHNLSMATLWKKQLFGTYYKEDLEVIEEHLTKVAGCVAESIDILRGMGKRAR